MSLRGTILASSVAALFALCILFLACCTRRNQLFFFGAALLWIFGFLPALMALGLRARHDPYLTAGLAAMARRPISDANEAAALLFALGRTRESLRQLSEEEILQLITYIKSLNEDGSDSSQDEPSAQAPTQAPQEETP